MLPASARPLKVYIYLCPQLFKEHSPYILCFWIRLCKHKLVTLRDWENVIQENALGHSTDENSKLLNSMGV
jgi:hypothetical protein